MAGINQVGRGGIMKFEVVTFGSSFVDVYLSSKEFKMIKTGSSPTGVAMCEVYGGKIGVDKLVITTGGGATNTAVGFERLGIQTGCVTCVGKDHWGAFIRQELRKEGVSQLYIQQVEELTSYSTILVGEGGGRSALVYRGASNKLSWHQVEWDKLEADWYYVSSLGGDLNLLTKILRTAQEKKIKVAFNPGSNEIAAAEKLKAFLPQVELVIINRQEAARLTKHEFKNKDEILGDIRKFGSRLVAITEGRKGATLIEGRKVISLPAIKVEVVEETGAGDAFGCGLVAGLMRYPNLEQALKLGLCNGASVVEHFGPKQGLLFSPEVEAWMKI